MKKILIYTIAMLGLVSCISNDIPYPVLIPNITSLEVAGSEQVDIDFAKRTVTVHFSETTDLRNVNIRSVEFDQEMTTSSLEIVGTHDLSKNPLVFTLTTYNEYEWRIVAVRDIERYFTVNGQVGSTVIDAENCRVILSVGKLADLTKLQVTSAKLGPEGDVTVYDPTLASIVGTAQDFSDVYNVTVSAFGATEVWSIYVEVVESSVSLGKVDPWTTEAYVNSVGVAGMENGFQYRRKGDDTWMDVPNDAITSDGGSFVGHITGLRPETEYEVLAYCGNDRTDAKEFTTGAAVQLPNSSFEYVSKVAGGDYYKFYDPSCGVDEGKTMFWGSGNGEGSEGVSGSAGLGVIITTVDTKDKVDGKQSVCAQTSETLGMLAAGNLFTGQFAGLVGTEGGKVNFGRPWTSRPRALKLYCKYSTGKMNIINGMPSGVSLSSADYDRAQIKVAVGNWDYRTYGGTPDSPVLVNTTDSKTFVDFAVDNSTIAYGELTVYNDGYTINRGTKVSGSTEAWVEYTIPLDYSKVDELPTHIIISCAASQYGDYFTGYSKSKLWLDAFELIY